MRGRSRGLLVDMMEDLGEGVKGTLRPIAKRVNIFIIRL